MVCTIKKGSSAVQNSKHFYYSLFPEIFIHVVQQLYSHLDAFIRMHDCGEIDVRACYTAISVSLWTITHVKCSDLNIASKACMLFKVHVFSDFVEKWFILQ